jgi:hypothetical protein
MERDMGIERRQEGNQFPEDFDDILNEEQLFMLNKMEGFGWELAFIRRPLFQEIITVLSHPDHGTYGILESDGRLNMQPAMSFR